jgi:hypothetical protein
MRKPPALATGLLVRLGPQDDSFVGDLVEAYGAGRSRTWYWRQVLAAIALTATHQAGATPVRTTLTVAAGWATLLLLFAVLGDGVAESIAGWIWGWNRQLAYQNDVWWPFAIVGTVVSYSGFASSAIVVARLRRQRPGPMLVAYSASLLLVLAASALAIEILTRVNGRVPVPHALFYVISVALPYQWRSGLVLAPLVVLAAGLAAAPRPATQ